jgi:phospholipase/carboxylesterase
LPPIATIADSAVISNRGNLGNLGNLGNTLYCVGVDSRRTDSARRAIPPPLTRRSLLTLGPAFAACAFQRAGRGASRLAARPSKPARTIEPGQHKLGLGRNSDGLLLVPKSYNPDTPAPLAVLLHGAGGRAERAVRLLAAADRHNILVLAPDSRASTWDAIRDDFGPDVEFVNRALDFTFERCAIDPRRLAIAGFSDGATYALSLGVDNGDLFTHILAFSPGFIVSREPQGRPRIFVSHGTEDSILPIASTSRRLVPALEKSGYAVTYREFAGPHMVPPNISSDACAWFVG